MPIDNRTEDIYLHTGSMSTHCWPVVGHDWAVESLAHEISAGCLGHAYLITGSSGIGKHTFATAFAQAVLCSEASTPCGECRTCRLIAQGKHPDVSVLTPVISGKLIKTAKIVIEPIRELIYRFSLRPVEAARRIAIISGFESATDSASNALLKTLEEPPGDGLLILTAGSTNQLLPTIVSRCEQLALRPLPRAEVKQALTERWNAPHDQAELFAHLSAGRMEWAVNMLNDSEALEQRMDLLDDMGNLLIASRVERFAYASLLQKDRQTVIKALDLWQSWWRDLILVTSGACTALTNIDREVELRSVARQLDPERAAQVVVAIHTTLEQMEKNANVRLALEVLMLELPWIDSNE